MSYFEGLKLTKKGEQLQAKINGNLSETLTFTKAKLGSGAITSNDEIRFLTDVKEVWGTANVTSCKIQGDEKNIVAIELQFSNAELREDKIFREIGLYAQGNEGEEILYAYANAGDKYDYIPLMKDSPHSFIIVIYFNITSGSKVDAKIDLHSYVSLQEFNEGMNKKVNKTDYASAEQYGIVKYGAEEGTVLEGNKFTQMMGKDYGGILNEPGLKTSGKAYWDNNTRKLYICKNNNSDISPNINNYIPFDNGSILERLENLYTTKEEKTKLTLAQINNVNLNSIIEPGFYVSVKWDNNISGLPTELNNNEARAFYLVVFALDSTNSYCQQFLYSFKGLIFYRAITGTNSTFTQWRRINLI
ncbi:pyocin knob domain-containing protein [Fusobacterium polymorphum]|uniref:pyocin knob domain-containing protein n=1 Tax=Fusobacterium nucleatum subsp. polymorphum TaxID=76857 RepID=UPI00300A3944